MTAETTRAPDRPRPGPRGQALSGARGRGVIDQMGWCPPLNPDPPVAPLGAEGAAVIDRAVMRILSGTGIRFRSETARARLRAAGCRVSDEVVRMEPAFVMEMICRAPARFTLVPRNPGRALQIGDGHVAFGTTSSAIWYRDLARGRVPGFMEGLRDLLRLAQAFDCIHFISGYLVEPADSPSPQRHLDCLQAMLTLTDKLCHAYALGPAAAEDAMEMVRLAAGLGEAEFRAAPRMFSNINTAAPLTYDGAVIDAALAFAGAGQLVIVTPYTLAGATAPAALPAAVAQTLAEALAAVALIQLVAPGAPVMLGTFTAPADRMTGLAAFGSADHMRLTQMCGEMARRYGLPLRASGGTMAHLPDGQAMWESDMALTAALQAGSAMIMHAAGWLEGGLVASPEKLVMDCEILQTRQRYMDPAAWQVGEPLSPLQADSGLPGPIVAERRDHDAWAADGALGAPERAHRTARAILATSTPPAMDPAAREALDDFVARRKA